MGLSPSMGRGAYSIRCNVCLIELACFAARVAVIDFGALKTTAMTIAMIGQKGCRMSSSFLV